MSTRVTRRIAAGTTALALAGLGLIGIGASAASAVDTIPADPTFGGSAYLIDGSEATDITPGTQVIAWNGDSTTPGTTAGSPQMVMAPSNFSSPVGVDPTTIGATEVWTFLAPQGQEGVKSAWNALASQVMTSPGQLLQTVTPTSLLNGGLGTPSGQAAVKAAGGNYSLGFAYTKNAGVTVVKTYFVHITIQAGTGNFTYEPVEQAVVKTATTTTVTSFPASVNTGVAFPLTATVSDATATGSIQFFDGATSLGTATLSGGTATLSTAVLTAAGNRSITAVYSGDSAFNGSTSPAVTVSATLAPITTTVTVGASSADGKANHPVVLSADITPVGAQGALTFTGSVDGGSVVTLASNVPVDADGHTEVSVTGLSAGVWTVNVAFTGTAPFVNSASTTAATVTLAASAPVSAPDDQAVKVAIPEGTLTITTPYTSANPLDLGTAVLDDATSTWNSDSDAVAAGFQPTVFGSASTQAQGIQIVDRRSGAPGFTAYVKSTDFISGPQSFSAQYLSLIDVAAHQVNPNTLQATDVTVNNIASLSASAQQFASYPANHATGTAWISGDVKLTGVPSNVQPGTYTATLTFTAL